MRLVSDFKWISKAEGPILVSDSVLIGLLQIYFRSMVAQPDCSQFDQSTSRRRMRLAVDVKAAAVVGCATKLPYAACPIELPGP